MAAVVIAEAGVNFNGDLKKAIEMIEVAAAAKADFVKFQTFKAASLASEGAQLAEYQKESGVTAASQIEMLEALELTRADHEVLFRHCSENGIGFLSTAFDIPSLHFLRGLGIDRIKVPSGEITNKPYLIEVATLGLPVYLSTGLSNYADVEAAINVLLANNMTRDQITILHCSTAYPTPLVDVNMKAMKTLGTAFDVKFGYSDHTLGYVASLAAISLGATVIEKHFTLDKSMPGPDQAASLDPGELIEFVRLIREAEVCLGSPVKQPSAAELVNLEAARRSIYASRRIMQGEVFSDKNICLLRPAKGMSGMDWDFVIGQKAPRDFDLGDLIFL